MMRRSVPKPNRLTRARPEEDADARILPLINIVFLLLIFFMVAGRLSVSDPFEVTPPKTGSAGEARMEGAEVLLGAAGELALDGEEMDRAQLMEHLASHLRDDPEIRLRLRADHRGEARDLVELMQALRVIGARDVTLITLPEAR